MLSTTNTLTIPFLLLLAALAGSTHAAFHQPLAQRSVSAHNNPKLAAARAQLAARSTTTTSCADSSASATATATAKASKCSITTRQSASSSSSATKSINNKAQQTASATSSASTSAASASSSTSASSDSMPDFYIGANSYFLHALPQESRLSVLDALVDANMKVVRIFISYTYSNNKDSGSVMMPDLESEKVGSYDDTILEAIDQLMVECKERGLKLIIALHDRYALGYWAVDAYATEFGIVDSDASGSPQTTDASNFYEQDDAKLAFDKRIDHILSHKNSLMDDRKWSELDDVIYALEPENEPMGHMDYISTWNCDRAGRIKENLPSDSSILVSTGGGIDTSKSLNDWAEWSCDRIDIVSVHDYGTTTSVTIPALQSGMSTAQDNGKKLMFGEWGASGASKAEIITDFVEALNDAQIPHMIWEIVPPGKGEADYEIWTSEPAWQAFVSDSSSSKRIVKRARATGRTYSKRAPVAQPRRLHQRHQLDGQLQQHNATQPHLSHAGHVLRARSAAEFAKAF